MIYIKYVCSASGHIIHASDFMGGIYMCIHVPYTYVKYMAGIYLLFRGNVQ